MLHRIPHALVSFVLGLMLTHAVDAQPTSSRTRADQALAIQTLSAADAEAFLEAFRAARPSVHYALDFRLIHLKARGASEHYLGRLYGALLDVGPVQRVDFALVSNKDGEPVQPSSGLFAQRRDALYFQAHRDGTHWEPISEEKRYRPLIEGVPIVPFDLQMPFIFWENWNVVGTERVLGRPAHIIEMIAPAHGETENPSGPARVRMAIDADFRALLRADYLDATGQMIKSVRVRSFKQVQDRWLPKSIDFIESGSREKVRMEVYSAAMDLSFDPQDFDPLSPFCEIDLSRIAFSAL